MRLPTGVYVLGAASLLNDAASEMVVPLLPVFLTATLGAAPVAVGVVEGAADAVAAVVKLVGGHLADRTGRHRPLVIGGYSLSNLVRPLIALSGSATMVLGVRVVDRIGKGIRTSPRDAILGGLVPPADRVRAYSVHRAMDHAGAVVGAILAWAALQFFAEDLRTVIALSVVPGVIAVVMIALFVPEPEHPVKVEPVRLGAIPPPLKRFLVAAGVLALGRASDTFLLLRAGQQDVGLAGLPLLWMLLHLVKSATSLGSARVADTLGRRGTIAAAWAVYALIHVLFSQVSGAIGVATLFVVYGTYHGLSEGAERALVAGLVPSHQRGTAFGCYHLVTGILALPAGLIFGGIWTAVGAPAAFLSSAAMAVAALGLFFAWWRRMQVGVTS